MWNAQMEERHHTALKPGTEDATGPRWLSWYMTLKRKAWHNTDSGSTHRYGKGLFSPRFNFQYRLSYGVRTQPVCNRICIDQHHSARTSKTANTGSTLLSQTWLDIQKYCSYSFSFSLGKAIPISRAGLMFLFDFFFLSFLILDAPSILTVLLERSTIHQIKSKSMVLCLASLHDWKHHGTMKLNDLIWDVWT